MKKFICSFFCTVAILLFVFEPVVIAKECSRYVAGWTDIVYSGGSSTSAYGSSVLDEFEAGDSTYIYVQVNICIGSQEVATNSNSSTYWHGIYASTSYSVCSGYWAYSKHIGKINGVQVGNCSSYTSMQY